jgi:hypothetical protein
VYHPTLGVRVITKNKKSKPAPRPTLPSEEETRLNILIAFVCKPRPKSGLDCFTCAVFAQELISQKVFIQWFRKSRFPHKSVNLSCVTTNIKDKLTDLCGNLLLQDDITNSFCETNADLRSAPRRSSLARATNDREVSQFPNKSVNLSFISVITTFAKPLYEHFL